MPPGSTARTGEGVNQFVTVTDTNTDKLAVSLAEALQKETGKRPPLIVANFSRKWIDANRPANDGYESSDAKPVYDLFHNEILVAIKKAKELKKNVLLLDIHGQGTDRNLVFRGTRDGKTLAQWTKRTSWENVFGTTGIFAKFARHDIQISPPPGSKENEHSSFNGGYIVATYGIHLPNGVDAIQLEFGASYRTAKAIPITAENLAKTIVEICELKSPALLN